MPVRTSESLRDTPICGKVAETGFKVGRSGVAASSVNGDELADWIVPIPSLIIVSVGTGSAGYAIRRQRRSAPFTQALMPVGLSRCWRQATPATSSHLGRVNHRPVR